MALGLPSTSLGRALDVAVALRFPDDRATALAALIPRLDGDLTATAAAALDTIASARSVPPDLVDALAQLAIRLPEPGQVPT
jgi:hypothetical protein